MPAELAGLNVNAWIHAMRAVCSQLGKRGAKVFVTGRKEENLKRTAAAVEEEGGYCAFGVGDVAEEADVKRLYREVSCVRLRALACVCTLRAGLRA